MSISLASSLIILIEENSNDENGLQTLSDFLGLLSRFKKEQLKVSQLEFITASSIINNVLTRKKIFSSNIAIKNRIKEISSLIVKLNIPYKINYMSKYNLSLKKKELRIRK